MAMVPLEVKIKDIPSNNKIDGDQKREKLKPVVKKEKVISTKKPFGKKMWDLFVGEDPKDVKDHLFNDILIPGVKNTILDALSMAFFGETISRGRGSRSLFGVTSYSSMYKGSKSEERRSDRNRKRNRYYDDDNVDYQNIVLENKADAIEVVNRMRDRIVNTGSISVAEFLDLMELPTKFTQNDWGWVDERDIGIKGVYNGFKIDVAEPVHLD